MRRNRATLPTAVAALALLASGAAAQDAEVITDNDPAVTTVEPVEDADVTVEGEPDVDIVTVEPGEGADLPGILYQQSEHTVLASTLMDADVINLEGDDIGDVADILLYPEGRIRGVLMEVGGFLEIGEKVIAVDFERLEIVRDEDGEFAVRLDATEDEVDDAPAFVSRAEAEEVAEERAEELAEERGEAAEEPLEERAERLEERADELEERAETVEQRTEERVEERAEERIEEEVLQ